jgi:hypothetical protein
MKTAYLHGQEGPKHVEYTVCDVQPHGIPSHKDENKRVQRLQQTVKRLVRMRNMIRQSGCLFHFAVETRYQNVNHVRTSWASWVVFCVTL